MAANAVCTGEEKDEQQPCCHCQGQEQAGAKAWHDAKMRWKSLMNQGASSATDVRVVVVRTGCKMEVMMGRMIGSWLL